MMAAASTAGIVGPGTGLLWQIQRGPSRSRKVLKGVAHCSKRASNLPSHGSGKANRSTRRRAPDSARPKAVPSSAPSELHVPDTASSSTADESARDQKDNREFSWASNWYAVGVLRHMDTAAPQPLTILGQKMVLWFDRKSSKWVAFADRCPHRLAPLSEGRITEQGDLQCSYHGWSFGADGTCTGIPQASSEGPEAKACANPRACATVFPTRQSQGLLFVWPDAQNAELAQQVSPPVIEEATEEMLAAATATQRDVEYGYEILAENVMDPSHLPFAHHRVGPLRREQGKPLPLTLAESAGVKGFSGRDADYVPGVNEGATRFAAPGLFTYYRKVQKDGKTNVGVSALFMTPLEPGRSRLIVYQKLFPKFVPAWAQHWVQQDLIDGDSYFLHVLERDLQTSADEPHPWRKSYFTPTSADRYVIAFRQWLEKHAGGKVKWAPGTDTSLALKPREQTMDRFHAHTKTCKDCNEALQAFKRNQKVLYGVAAALLAVDAALGEGSSLQARILLAVLSVALAGGGYYFGWLSKFFVYRGYDHARVP